MDFVQDVKNQSYHVVVQTLWTVEAAMMAMIRQRITSGHLVSFFKFPTNLSC